MMTDTLNWNIERSCLINYKNDAWKEEYFVSTRKNEIGIMVYNIDEWRMLSYGGLLAIFSNPSNPKLELNSDKTWIWFDNQNTFYFLERSGCIACRKPSYNTGSKKGEFPFMLINMKDRTFGFIEFNSTSIYYGLEETDQGLIRIIEIYPKSLKNLKKSDIRTNEFIDITTLKWFSFTDFDYATERYTEN